MRTVLDKHSPPSLRKVITHSSSPWFESIRDELFIAKRERRQAERKWRNTKLTIFKDLYRQAKHKVSKLVHTAKCKFYTEAIALASSSKELHQVVNTLSNGHPPKILPTIYPSADLPSIFIKHFTNKVEKLRANIASEHVTSTLVIGTTAATFSSFKKVSQFTVKECILSSAPKSCELNPIPSKLSIECLDYILPSHIDLFNSMLYTIQYSYILCLTLYYYSLYYDFQMYVKPLSDIIDSHSIMHHSFADDLQLQISTPPDGISELLHSMQSCIGDVKAWVTANMLELNDNKT